MKVLFYDRRSSRSSPGEPIRDRGHLIEALNQVGAAAPAFCELVADEGHELLVGIGGRIGCAQYSNPGREPPYLMATLGTDNNTDECIDFPYDDTATPVPMRYCLPAELITEIAIDFLKTGKPSSLAKWEEI
jgi:hypothetical protein